ncbi:PREDICTED: nucleic-acid-binding protein from mobile element jockey-like [Eufriesea mexicana]|uniref:nucleic-acid-binding protein from mobile element jockey-like n=1 Tax=Eufriesea mexicana TaxID=516756 RepID=UPI00083C16BB|nr:PREDICTED: nucleic-acid-binding protein from mobile element jockey-like [Eufriesea mexicana]
MSQESPKSRAILLSQKYRFGRKEFKPRIKKSQKINPMPNLIDSIKAEASRKSSVNTAINKSNEMEIVENSPLKLGKEALEHNLASTNKFGLLAELENPEKSAGSLLQFVKEKNVKERNRRGYKTGALRNKNVEQSKNTNKSGITGITKEQSDPGRQSQGKTDTSQAMGRALNRIGQAKAFLQEVNTMFYTYIQKTEKPQTLLIKGLNNIYSNEEILKELQKQNIPDISPNSNANNVVKIKYIHHQVIKWEKLKKKEITQCHKCQMIGHTARNCSMDYRCVKCNEPHEPGMCKIPKTAEIEKEKTYCVKCKTYGHSASYRGCPMFTILKERLKQKIENNKQKVDNKIIKIAKKVDPNISFSSIVKNSNVNENENTTTKPNNAFNNPTEILSTILNSINDIKNAIISMEQRSRENEERLDIFFDALQID